MKPVKAHCSFLLHLTRAVQPRSCCLDGREAVHFTRSTACKWSGGHPLSAC